eukprot:m.520908 g.520908  ORF g.520908 m.520908 type:complete len:801 (+) comp21956_c0_seq4:408-2810(+)
MATMRLAQQLRKYGTLKNISAPDLSKLTWATRQSIYLTLLRELEPNSMLDGLVQQHLATIAAETSAPPPSPGVLERGFRTAFSKLAYKEIIALQDKASSGSKAPIKSYNDILSDTKRAENYMIFGWLLDRIQDAKDTARKASREKQRRAVRSMPAAASPRRTKAASSSRDVLPAGVGRLPPSPPPQGLGVPTPPDTLPNLYFGDAPEKVHWRDNFKKVDSDEENSSDPPGTGSDSALSHESKRGVDPVGTDIHDIDRTSRAVRSECTNEPAMKHGRRGTSAAAVTPTRHTGTRTTTPSKLGDRGKDNMVSKDEHDAVTKELAYVRALYDQLVNEASAEKFHVRRVQLLKSQNMQLERQVLLYANALDARTDASQMVENVLHETEALVTAALDGCTGADADTPAGLSAASSSSVARGLRSLQRLSRDTLSSLTAAADSAHPDTLALPFAFSSPLARANGHEPSLLTVCQGGGVPLLDTEKLSRLETSLAELYEQLDTVQSRIGVLTEGSRGTPGARADIVGDELQARYQEAVHACIDQLRRATHDLLSLGALLPTKVVPRTSAQRRNSVSFETMPDVDALLQELPGGVSGTRQVRQERKQILAAAIDQAAKVVDLLEASNEKLYKELEFHWKLHGLNTEYCDALSQGWESLEDTCVGLAQPLTVVLRAYDDMASTTSEASLRAFLRAFKTHESAIRTFAAKYTDGEAAAGDTSSARPQTSDCTTTATAALSSRLCATAARPSSAHAADAPQSTTAAVGVPQTGARALQEHYVEALNAIHASVATQNGGTAGNGQGKPDWVF